MYRAHTARLCCTSNMTPTHYMCYMCITIHNILYWRHSFWNKYISLSDLEDSITELALCLCGQLCTSGVGVKLCHNEDILVPPQSCREMTRQNICWSSQTSFFFFSAGEEQALPESNWSFLVGSDKLTSMGVYLTALAIKGSQSTAIDITPNF